jgi:sulfite reductase (ferredoxin)
MIRIPHTIVNSIIHTARRGAPLETCGLLGGQGEVISFFYELTNADASAEHFTLIPEEHLFAIKDARRRGLNILGVVHSHPASPARPSEEDLKLANDPNMLYFILSLAGPEPVLKVFQIRQHIPREVPLEIAIGTREYGRLVLPDSVVQDIQGVRHQVESFVRKETDAVRFRAYRVPMGLYEQRQDGAYMARTRLPGGVADAHQLETLADLAERFGQGVLHFTTRQDIQLHNLAIENVPTVLETLLGAGLVCRGGGGNTVRNITGSPLAGLSPTETFDILPYVVQISEHLLPHAGSYNLPRKYKIALVSEIHDERLLRVADLGLRARLKDGQPGFEVWAGGGMGTHSLPSVQIAEFIPAQEAVLYAEAIKRLFDQYGDRTNKHRARLRFVVQRLGESAFKELVQQFLAQVRQEIKTVPPLRVRQYAAVGGKVLSELLPDVVEGVGPGRYAIRFRPWLGDVTSAELRTIAQAVKRYALEFRADCGQGFYLAQVKGEDVAAILETLKAFYQPVPAAAPLACTGAATCRLGMCLSRGLAQAIRETVLALPEDRQKSLPRIRISGCPNSCGQHPVAELGFYGAAKRVGGRLMPFYNVVVFRPEGKTLGQKVGDLPAKAVPAFIQQLESLDTIAETLAAFQTYPSYEEAPDYYRDWGQTVDFSLAGRGPGECGAGVLDVIELDLKTAENELRQAENSQGAVSSAALYQAAVAAMRSLLIIRGVETQKPREIFSAFQQHFILPGWVDPAVEKFIPALLDFRLGDLADLQAWGPLVRSLAARIRELYASLDGNLNFRITPLAIAEKAADALAAEPASDLHQVDLRGTPCPMNFVLAKLEIEKIPVGHRLEVYLDEGDPIKNVPASFQDQGQNVEKIGDAPGKGKSVIIRRTV